MKDIPPVMVGVMNPALVKAGLVEVGIVDCVMYSYFLCQTGE